MQTTIAVEYDVDVCSDGKSVKEFEKNNADRIVSHPSEIVEIVRNLSCVKVA